MIVQADQGWMIFGKYKYQVNKYLLVSHPNVVLHSYPIIFLRQLISSDAMAVSDYGYLSHLFFGTILISHTKVSLARRGMQCVSTAIIQQNTQAA